MVICCLFYLSCTIFSSHQSRISHCRSGRQICESSSAVWLVNKQQHTNTHSQNKYSCNSAKAQRLPRVNKPICTSWTGSIYPSLNGSYLCSLVSSLPNLFELPALRQVCMNASTHLVKSWASRTPKKDLNSEQDDQDGSSTALIWLGGSPAWSKYWMQNEKLGLTKGYCCKALKWSWTWYSFSLVSLGAPFILV